MIKSILFKVNNFKKLLDLLYSKEFTVKVITEVIETEEGINELDFQTAGVNNELLLTKNEITSKLMTFAMINSENLLEVLEYKK